MQLAAANTVLLVIDMQNAFCADDGGCARAGLPVVRTQAAIEPCRRLIGLARLASVPVIYSRYVLARDYADAGVIVNELWPHLKDAGALRAGTRDIEILDGLRPLPGDIVIDKNRPSAFFGTELARILGRLDTTRLVVCGVTTNCCVESTVRDAGQRDFHTFVVADAVAEYEEDRHEIALKSMARLFGHVVSLADVATAWARPADVAAATAGT